MYVYVCVYPSRLPFSDVSPHVMSAYILTFGHDRTPKDDQRGIRARYEIIPIPTLSLNSTTSPLCIPDDALL